MGSRWMRNTFIYLLIVVAVVAIVWSLLAPRSSSPETKSIGEVVTLAQQGDVQAIEVSGANLTVRLKGDSQEYKSRLESGTNVYQVLSDAGVNSDKVQAIDIKAKGQSPWSNWLTILFNILPIVIIGAVLIFMLRQAQGSNSHAMSIGKSRARMFSGSKIGV